MITIKKIILFITIIPSVFASSSLWCMEKKPTRDDFKKCTPATNYNFMCDRQANIPNYPVIAVSGLHQLLNRQGHTLEDACCIIKKYSRFDLFAVFDGHGGNAVSNYLKERMGDYILENLKHLHSLSESTIIAGIKRAMIKFDTLILKNEKFDCEGSTAIIAIVDKTGNKLYVANLGDSRAILIRPGMDLFAKPLSNDHKASDITEKLRIMNAGGKVIHNRVGGGLAMSRSFGDRQFKISTENTKKINMSTVMSEPEIIVRPLSPHQFLILGSDGLWDALSNENAGDIIENNHEEDPSQLAQRLTLQAAAQGSTDDISAMVIKLSHAK